MKIINKISNFMFFIILLSLFLITGCNQDNSTMNLDNTDIKDISTIESDTGSNQVIEEKPLVEETLDTEFISEDDTQDIGELI